MPIRDTISEVINRVLADAGRPRREISGQDTLTGSLGLDSLDLAVVVVGLEQQLGVDPFRNGAPPIRTFDQLVALYEGAVKKQVSEMTHQPPGASPRLDHENRGLAPGG